MRTNNDEVILGMISVHPGVHSNLNGPGKAIDTQS
jgi:hypothetical protein